MGDSDDIQGFNKQLDFPKLPYSIFRDKFAHHTPFSLRFSNQSEKRAMNFDLNLRPKNQKIQLSHQMNLLWRVNGSKALLTRIRPNNYIKVHYDNGIQTWNELFYNLYCSITAKGLSVSSLKGGLHVIGKYFQADTRVKFHHFEQSDFTLYHRSLFKYGIMRVGLVGSLKPKPFSLMRGAVVLGAEVNDNLSIFTRFENKSIRQGKPTVTSLDVIYSVSQSLKLGSQINYDQTNKLSGQVVLERKINFFVDFVKLKLNNTLGTTFLFKFTTPLLGDQVTHWLGISHSGFKLEQNKANLGFRIGLRTEFNS